MKYYRYKNRLIKRIPIKFDKKEFSFSTLCHHCLFDKDELCPIITSFSREFKIPCCIDANFTAHFYYKWVIIKYDKLEIL